MSKHRYDSPPEGILRSVSALTLVQLSAYLAPLISLPLLSRQLEVKQWGALMYAQATALWLTQLVEYGFSLSATKELAGARMPPNREQAFCNAVYGAQILLFLAVGVLIVFAGIWRIVPLTPTECGLCALIAAAQGGSPGWYFQGKRRLTEFSLISLGSRVVWVIFLIAFVGYLTRATEVLMSQALVTGIATMLLVYRTGQYQAIFEIGIKAWITQLRFGASYFSIRVATSLYTYFVVVLVGLVRPEVAAAYATADRLCRAAQGLFGTASTAAFPHFVALSAERKGRADGAFRTYLIVVGILSIGIATSFSLFSSELIRTVFGPSILEAAEIFSILAWILPVVAINNVLGIQRMLPLGLFTEFRKIIFTAAVFGPILVAAGTLLGGGVGAAWSLVVTELGVLFAMKLALDRVDQESHRA